MWLINLSLLSLKQIRRHWLRSLLTIAGTACGMFLFMTVETFQDGLKSATEMQAGDDTLVVYRDKRFCPFTSRLPEDYANKISQIDGVKSVVPVQVIVNNCGTSLDTITFRGFPSGEIQNYFAGKDIDSALFSSWKKASDSAILGKDFAQRRGLNVGDRFDAAGITVRISGILESDDPQDQNTAFVHLDFLQKSSKRGLGEVTQFNVKVNDHTQLDRVAKEIDQSFRYDREPTHTRPEKAFIANTAKDMIELISFTRWLGLAAVLAVSFLITNTVIIAVRGRVIENAVMQAMGFQIEHLAWMTMAEGLFMGMIGGFVGIGGAYLFLSTGNFAISAEGLSIVFNIQTNTLLKASALAMTISFVAGIYPAFHSVQGNLVNRLRSH
ncbi:ABC transporter permease [Lentisphaera profundi]|uniref:ABC transporter permease n=1 Tax=Lentisphaera profundi TaxID=1658616 RepID=A0ABY7VXX2_9BACT|nr:ABC transporter permease [Lentisphaera profundi]WDE97554.1 ABC transporter permease [Lentisphaera profundi]